MTALLVFTTVPDAATAERIAQDLVQSRLAACVNIGQTVNSLYHWQERIEKSIEVPMVIKTTTHRYDALEARLRALHPYELPEILAVPVTSGLPGYLRWLAAETAGPAESNV